MGLFSSSSTTNQPITQSDERQVGQDQAVNQNFADTSAAFGNAQNLNSEQNSFLAAATARDNARSLQVSGDNSAIFFEDLNAELAKFSIEETGKRISESLTESLGFQETVLDKLFAAQEQNQQLAANSLEDTRNFAADIISERTQTADERLESFSKSSMFVLAGLTGLILWRAF